MTAKSIAAPLPGPVDLPPFARAMRQIVLRLIGRVGMSAQPQRALAVEDRVALGPKRSLVLVRCHERLFLVPVSGDAIGPLTEVAKPRAVRKNSTSSSQRAGQERAG